MNLSYPGNDGQLEVMVISKLLWKMVFCAWRISSESNCLWFLCKMSVCHFLWRVEESNQAPIMITTDLPKSSLVVWFTVMLVPSVAVERYPSGCFCHGLFRKYLPVMRYSLLYHENWNASIRYLHNKTKVLIRHRYSSHKKEMSKVCHEVAVICTHNEFSSVILFSFVCYDIDQLYYVEIYVPLSTTVHTF